MLALGIASYLSLYPVLLLPPLILLCYDRIERDTKTPSPMFAFASKHIALFFGSIAWLLYTSYILTGGSWEFLASTYGVHLLLPDLTPNVGLWWYFFIEMFDSFREFFLGVFWLHLGGYVGGLCIRVRKQPLFIITCLLGIFAIFKPYPSLSDTSLYFAMLPLYRHVFPRKSSLHRFPLPPAHHLSNALYILRHGDRPIHVAARPRLLLLVDICRFRQRQFFLRHHARVESRLVGNSRRLAFRSVARRMGSRAPRNEGQGRSANLAIHPINHLTQPSASPHRPPPHSSQASSIK